MSTALTLDANLTYFASLGAALFPCRAGGKNPLIRWKSGSDADPARWLTWQQERHNLAIDCAKSGLIMLDVDASKVTREQAWTAYCTLTRSWGLSTPPAPMTQSGRGGWHVPFRRPAAIAAADLRGGGTLVKVSDVRPLVPEEKDGEVIGFKNRGYCVAPGSYLDSPEGPLFYLLLPGAPAEPHPCPAPFLETLTLPVVERDPNAKVGNYDFGDALLLYKWLVDHDAFTTDEDWYSAGMIARLEFGDNGLELWETLCRDPGGLDATSLSRWTSFATEMRPGAQTLLTLLKRAHALGWTGSVRNLASASEMFAGSPASAIVAQLAKDAGATTHSATQGMTMLAGQAELARLAAPILDEFMTATADAPTSPATQDFPTLPKECVGHDLYEPMQAALRRICALAEPGQKLKPSRLTDVLAVLGEMHLDVFESVCRRLRAWGHALQDRRIKLAIANLSEAVQRVTVTFDKWEYDSRGEIQHDNSDNVQVLLGVLGLSVRWNAWLERMEIQGGGSELRYSSWTYIDDAVVAKLRTRANRTKTRFRPGKEFFWESLLSIAHTAVVDPVLDMLVSLQQSWDGTPRLGSWLAATCSTPDDPYHQAVGRNIIGGMVRRVRHPGCKHDTMAVFYGYQGSGKSTMAAIIADMGQSSLPAILLGNGQHFTDTVLLGDASKELVLSLAGKLVAEIGEMGMRGSANPNHVKAMISRQVDAGRTAYARAVTERQRRNIFIGTTNDDEPLVDPTGNRRFLPVKVEREVDLAWLHANAAQLVGEAAAMEAAGEQFGLPREVWGAAAERQEAARAESDVETLLTDWFAVTPHTETAYITAADLIHLSSEVGWRGGNTVRGATMRALGFRSENVMLMGKKTRVWMRAEVAVVNGNRTIVEGGIRHNIAGAVRGAVRYIIGADSHGRVMVSIRSESPTAPVPPCPC